MEDNFQWQPVHPKEELASIMYRAGQASVVEYIKQLIKEEEGEEKLSTKKKKALEIKKVKEGVKTFGAINPASLPDTPSGGVNTP